MCTCWVERCATKSTCREAESYSSLKCLRKARRPWFVTSALRLSIGSLGTYQDVKMCLRWQCSPALGKNAQRLIQRRWHTGCCPHFPKQEKPSIESAGVSVDCLSFPKFFYRKKMRFGIVQRREGEGGKDWEKKVVNILLWNSIWIYFSLFKIQFILKWREYFFITENLPET